MNELLNRIGLIIEPDWDSLDVFKRIHVSQRAADIIAAYEARLVEEGKIILPREPTEAMTTAGEEASNPWYGGELHPEAIWRAMIDAASSRNSDAS